MGSFRQEWVAGAFVNRMDGGVNSLTGINCSSASTFADATVNSLTGAAGWRGIAIMNSGTSVVSVAATAAQSGSVILATVIQYTGGGLAAFRGLGVTSVRAGAFEIVMLNNATPTVDMPIAWMVVR